MLCYMGFCNGFILHWNRSGIARQLWLLDQFQKILFAIYCLSLDMSGSCLLVTSLILVCVSL